MKLIAIITLITIFVLLAPGSEVFQYGMATSPSTEIHLGNYLINPVNSSACDYSLHLYNNSSLNVRAADYYNISGIKMESPSGNYSFEISWQPYYVYSLSEAKIFIVHNGVQFALHFGVEDGMYIYENSTTMNGIYPFREGIIYGFNIWWLNNSPYIEISNGINIFLYRPQTKPATVDSNFIILEGHYYNINLTLRNPVNFNFIDPSSDYKSYPHITEILKNSNLTGDVSFIHPFLDRTLNLFILPDRNGTIYALNPETHILTTVEVTGKPFNYSFSYGNTIYFISYHYNSFNILFLNQSDLKSKVLTYNISGDPEVAVYHSDLYAFSQNYVLNLTNNNISFLSGNFPQDERFLGVHICEYPEYYFMGKNWLSNYIIRNGHLTEYMNYTNLHHFTILNEGSSGMSLEMEFNHSEVYLISSENMISSINITYVDGQSLMERVMSQSYIIKNSDYIEIPDSISGFAGNFSSGIVWSSDGSFYLYGSFSSSGNLSISWHIPIIRYAGFFNISITSQTSYIAALRIGNLTYMKNNSGDFFLNLSSYATGKYIFNISVSDEQGLFAERQGYIIVDNSVPKILLNNISNGVFAGEHLQVQAIDSAGIKSINVDVNGQMFSGNQSTLNFTIPYFESTRNITIFIKVTDDFNFSTSTSIYAPFYYEHVGRVFLNIHNNEIINKTYFNVTVNGNYSNISCFILNFTNLSSNSEMSFSLGEVSQIYLPDGTYSYQLYALFIPGNREEIENGTLRIDNKKPDIHIGGTGKEFYSLLKSSLNRSFNISFTSNMNGTWNINITGPDGTHINYVANGRYFNISSDQISYFLKLSGKYMISAQFISFNNYKANSSSEFFMENLLPQVRDKYVIYTNKTDVSIDINSSLNSSYHFLYLFNKKIIKNNTINLNFTGNYTVQVEIYNKAMAFERTSVEIIYSNETPEITLENFTERIENGYEANYTVNSGWIPIENLSVRTDLNYSITSNKLRLFFNRDGNYTFSIYVINLCGNRFQKNFSLSVQSIPLIWSISVSYIQRFSNFYGKVNVYGYVLKNLSIQWFDNGRISGKGNALKISMPAGTNHIEVEVVLGNIVKYGNITIFSIPMSTLIFISLPLGALILFLFLPWNSSQIMAANIILNNNGATLKKLKKIARRKHIGAKTLESALKKLENGGILKIGSDLNGENCIKILKSKKK